MANHQSFGEASWGYLNAISFWWWLLASVLFGVGATVTWLLTVSLLLTGALGGVAIVCVFLFFLAWTKYEGEAPVLSLTLASVAHSAATRIDASSPDRAAVKRYAQPDIEFVNPLVAWKDIDQQSGRLIKSTDSFRGIDTMLARFHYKADRNVPPTLKLRGLISIANSEGVPIKARYDGTWDEKYSSPGKYFGTGDTCALVVCLFPPAKLNDCESILTWGFGLDGERFSADSIMLKGTEFRMTIELVGKEKESNDVVLNDAFDFDVNVPRRSMEFKLRRPLLR